MFVWKSQFLRQSPRSCVLQWAVRFSADLLSISHSDFSSLQLIAEHSRPLKHPSHLVIECLLCCQPSQKITSEVSDGEGGSADNPQKGPARSCHRISLKCNLPSTEHGQNDYKSAGNRLLCLCTTFLIIVLI